LWTLSFLNLPRSAPRWVSPTPLQSPLHEYFLLLWRREGHWFVIYRFVSSRVTHSKLWETPNPLDSIWMRPLDYREITKGTAYDPSCARTRTYRRQLEHEALMAAELTKLRLLEEGV
jgi:hypothetical protein